MKTHIDKADPFSPVFVNHGNELSVRAHTLVAGHPLDEVVKMPDKLTAGSDYEITVEDGIAVATLILEPPSPGAIGGFHVAIDGQILGDSIWDCKFRPKAEDPRGMVLVSDFWVDIYLLGKNALHDGTSRADSEIANHISWWQAIELLATHDKQLLSMAEFFLATQGVEENKTAGDRPEKTGHIDGLRSRYGLEQATGCYWTWGREFNSYNDYATVLGGGWASDVAGPRRWDCFRPGDFWYFIGARGRCDHLILG